MKASIKKKIGKQVWFHGKLWDVVEIISPTKFDDYILVKRNRPDQVHNGSKISPIDMELIDCRNDEFLPDTEPVKHLIGELQQAGKKAAATEKELKDIWLNTIA